jgi:two-component system, OmpR family, phosphate regulon response regulator PhoB
MEKIALVDDDPAILEVFTYFIDSFGYQPLPFQDPVEALKKIPDEEPAPALILLDLMMTPITGLQFLEERRQIARLATIPVMIVSAWGLSEEDMKKYEGDICGTIKKPVQFKDLRAIIDKNVALHRGYPEITGPSAS